MKAVFLRELQSCLVTMTGWIFIAFMLAFMGFFTMVYCLNYGYGNFEYVLSSLLFVYLLVVPLLTMRCFAEERRQHTDQLLYSLPLSSAKITIGKYAAMLVVLAIPLLVSCTYPVILSLFGTIYYPTAYICIFAFFLLGAALTAIGMFASSLCESQVTAAVVCFGFLLVDYFLTTIAGYIPSDVGSTCVVITVLIIACVLGLAALTKNGIVAVAVGIAMEVALVATALFDSAALEGFVADLMADLCLFDRFSLFVSGVFDVTSIVFYAAVGAVFVFLTMHSFEKRRWS